MFKRYLKNPIREALKESPVILLHGARQTGKSTLAKAIGHNIRYLTFDDVNVLASAKNDPVGFLNELPERVIFDEVQRVPELFLSIKASVDRNRKPGRFLLTGSANALLLPRLADSLAGRMEVFTLYPLSRREMEGKNGNIIDQMFHKKWTAPPPIFSAKKSKLFEMILTGGYPEVVARKSEARQKAWFENYINAILHRDVNSLTNVEGLIHFPRLLALLATRASGLLNFADLSRSLSMPQTTLKRYLALLETTFLVELLPPWFANLGSRLIKTPKLFLCDTGLLGHLLGINASRILKEPSLSGMILENYVVMELRKQSGWSETKPKMFHYRTHAGQEVDIVLENNAGELIGIEVKASETISRDDFKGLNHFAEATGEKFLRGIVLYTGRESLPFGNNLYAVPINCL